MKISELKNKKIAILWFWKEGESTLSFLRKLWIIDITILDREAIVLLNDTSKIKTISGDKYLDELDSYDIIFKTPGISPFQEKLESYRNKFVSQTSIFFENYGKKVIAITGTKGKSTIATLTYLALKQAGYKVKLVGNIGKPVLDEINILEREEYEYVVYEMSSYMLQDFIPRTFISLFNNVYTCHIDWHKSFDVYEKAKLGILEQAQHKLVNNEFTSKIEWNFEVFWYEWKYYYKEKDFFIDEQKILNNPKILLEGEHNKKNICGVMGILDIVIWENQKIRKVLEQVLWSFSWLPDRMERIRELNGITFINDAIATTPESSIAAINTFEEQLGTLFLGGEDSGFDFSTLRKKVLDSGIQNIIAFPDAVEKIFPEIGSYDFENPFSLEIEGKSMQFFRTRSMKSWVDFAYKNTQKWKIALLSCAAPSFSIWKSYRVKAEEFKKYVEKL